MKLDINIDNITLDILTTKLKKVVSPLDILKWLSNFKKFEVNYALDILSNLTVYTTNEIEEILNDSFEELITNIDSGCDLVVCPLGKFGKSGSMISYFFQKTTVFRTKKKRINLNSNISGLKLLEDKSISLVIIDDFIGTGKSFETFYLSEIEPLSASFKDIYFIGIAGMDFGIHKVESYVSKVLIPKSNIFKKAFSSQASYFGYRKYINYRAFAYKYGAELVKSLVMKSGKENALGYDNSQSLVSFAYGTPNNSLPIIWSSSDGWIPLIPRFSIDRVSNSKNIRKDILHELSILREFGSNDLKDTFFSYRVTKGKRTFTSVNKLDFSIYSIIKLSRKRYTSASICQILGILHKDYEQLIKDAVSKGILNTDSSLTTFGLNIYYDAKKCVDKRKKIAKSESNDFYEIKKIIYLPKTFNGKS